MQKHIWVLALLISNICFGAGDLPDNFHVSKLANGLELLVIEDNSVPLVTVEIVVRNGAYTETPEYDGLSHLYEHMFFKANEVYPSQEQYMAKVHELGIVFNGTTSNERVNYFMTLGSDKLEEGMQFINDAIEHPLFLKEEMEKENLVVDGEFQRNESDLQFLLYDALQKRMWGDNYSRKNTIGDHDIIKTATPAKMKEIQKKYYYPNNSLLAIAGDVNHEEVFRLAEKIYGQWEACDFDPFEKWPIPEMEPLKKDMYFIEESSIAPTPIVMMGYHGPDTRNDVRSTYAADVLSFILSQKTSTFHKEMIESGLARHADMSYYTCKYTGPISMTLVPDPARIGEATEALLAQVDKMDQDDYFTDEQLETAKNLLVISDAYGSEKTSDYLHTVTFWWASASIDYYTGYAENVRSITREDIKKYVRTYLQDQHYVLGVMANKEQRAAAKLDAYIKSQSK